MHIIRSSFRIVRYISVLSLLISLLLGSCRKEEYLFLGNTPDRALESFSHVASLFQKTTMHDGSPDNLIDGASCFSIEFPYVVTANGTEVELKNTGDIAAIEAIFKESAEDVDTLSINFPINLLFSDYTTQKVYNQTEFNVLAGKCPGADEDDEDIECIDFKYPISISVFDTAKEALKSISVSSDKEFFFFINALDEKLIVNIDFPLILISSEGDEVEVNDLAAVEEKIELFKDTCDENDHSQLEEPGGPVAGGGEEPAPGGGGEPAPGGGEEPAPGGGGEPTPGGGEEPPANETNCIGCTTDQLFEAFAACTQWAIDTLVRNNTILDGLYSTYSFDFRADGTLVVDTGITIISGSWTATGTGTAMQMEIFLLGLEDLNGIWDVDGVPQSSANGMLNLIKGIDVLSFDKACPVAPPPPPVEIPLLAKDVLVVGSWKVASLLDGLTDLTDSLLAYGLTFNSDGSVVANDGLLITVNGGWASQNNDLELMLDFGLAVPVNLLNGNWEVVSVTDTQVELRIIGLVDRILVLTRN